MFYLYAFAAWRMFLPSRTTVTFILVCKKNILSLSRFHSVSVFHICCCFYIWFLDVYPVYWPSPLLKILVRHLQKLHAHNHIHSVWIDVDLANFFVYVWNQFVCKSIMSECNHLSFVLPYQKQNTKPSKTFSLCAYEHWPHLLYIYLLWIENTKTDWSNRHSMWNFEIPAAAEWQIEIEKKIFEIYFTFCLFIREQMLYHFDIIWMFHSIFINCLRW